eukprot:gnl/TRDRNA2_/TRDRNA2_142166_c0_seq1.p1 gnl/TRDRNA2_/TRDRNA2_142166_c0~~gnl/TRDRNA2_/TRDRNA2_142166_c0_seq1.p1  ORF type:complete len:214 (-),score=25.63 gnl/TRDRNA2_/TRDRNA2_142166_c0_seq1:61-702(-)
MMTILRLLRHRQVVLLHCERPLGRSSLLVEIAHYVSVPGRTYSGCCTFAPAAAEGGLLVVDEGDEALRGPQRHALRQHLKVSGARLLIGCAATHWDPFDGEVKVVHVPLPPLTPSESADLFLRRCHRPLVAADLLGPERLAPGQHSVVVRREIAMGLLEPLMPEFKGDPGQVRRAAAQVTPKCPVLNGDLSSLLAGTTLPPKREAAVAAPPAG